MNYQLLIKSSSDRAMSRLPRADRERLNAKVLRLAANPRPAGCEKLAGHSDLYRIRVGDWRAVYSIDDAARTVLLVLVAHRREVYRGL